MMRQITTGQLTKFLTVHQPPCISLYLPTHRSHPENQQDPIRYRNLLKQTKVSLLQNYPKLEVNTHLEQFQAIATDDGFWNHRTDGLAILGSSDTFQVFELQRTIPELVVVADSFHIKPLLRIVQSAERYQILALNRHEAKLYEGNRDALDAVELAEGVPGTIEEALGDELTEPHLTVGSYGGKGGRAGSHGAPSMHHGHGQKKDEVENDNDRFFRAIDRAILEHHSRPSGLPLMLAALPEHHALFRKVSHNPFLMDVAIGLDSGLISADHLRSEGWQAMEPKFQEKVAKLVDKFEEARSKHLGSADLTDIAQALIAGRVGILLVEADRQVPGKLDPASGRIELADFADPEIDDLLDDMAEVALKMGGEVVVIPTEHMPTTSGAAATYRF
jgi:hypothetical protein